MAIYQPTAITIFSSPATFFIHMQLLSIRIMCRLCVDQPSRQLGQLIQKHSLWYQFKNLCKKLKPPEVTLTCISDAMTKLSQTIEYSSQMELIQAQHLIKACRIDSLPTKASRTRHKDANRYHSCKRIFRFRSRSKSTSENRITFSPQDHNKTNEIFIQNNHRPEWAHYRSHPFAAG